MIDQANAQTANNTVFSVASADKIVNTAGFKADSDREVVARLMDELVALFSKQWHAEQEKQKEIKQRFKADVPLLTLTPKTWKEAFTSPLPVVLVGVIVEARWQLTGIFFSSSAWVGNVVALRGTVCKPAVLGGGAPPK